MPVMVRVMQSMALVFITLASAWLLLWAYSVIVALDPNPSNPFYPPTPLEKVSLPASLAGVLALQFLFARLSRGKTAASQEGIRNRFGVRLALSSCLTLAVAGLAFVVLAYLSGV